MLKNFTLIALATLFVTAFTSCQKDPESGANPGGTSYFTLGGAPGSCTSPVIAGSYNTGIELTQANTITLTVNVAATGTYNVHTNSNNGVYFLGGGTFTTTGPQTITLAGHGTATNTGNFTFVLATFNTCSFPLTFGSGSGGGPAAVYTYAGGTGNCTGANVNGVYASLVTLNSSNYVDLTVNVTTAGSYNITTTGTNGISFAGSGTFTAAGNGQVVRLFGNGTPLAQGSYDYTPTNNGCKFSVTVAPPPPPAMFTYTNCGSVVPQGTYTAGIALNSSNTIVLTVNVTTAGAYSVSTDLQNGVTFRGSGLFSATGPNSITLTSTDTPLSGATFPYIIAGGCAFNVTYTSAPPPPTEFIKFSVDGGPITTFAINPSGFDDNSSAPFNISVDADLTSGGDNFSISVTDENNPVVTAFDYSNRNLLAFPTKYCEIVYTTGSGNPYGSSIINNSFTVRLTSLNATTVTGIFSGKVYADFGTGTGFKTISTGTFSINF
jgi:hypothetical protein